MRHNRLCGESGMVCADGHYKTIAASWNMGDGMGIIWYYHAVCTIKTLVFLVGGMVHGNGSDL